jgi:hypothetical protein
MLRNGLDRHPDALDTERLPVLAFLAELLARVGDRDEAAEVLDTIARLDLDRSDPDVGEQLDAVGGIREAIGSIGS